MNTANLPETIGRYQVLRHLASGGMADLYLCRQAGPGGFEKLVAVKRIREELCLDDEFTTMFLDESRVAALLTHANIAQIYELGLEDDQPFLAMEFVNGRSISAIMKVLRQRGGRIPPQLAVQIIVGVLRGLDYAHSKKDLSGQPLNLVHRDVTPQNVLISVDGEIKLVDFGIAKATTQVAQTRHGVLKGKYAYMSPEQIKAGQGLRIDGRSDLFACGILLYELLCNQRPFRRDSAIDTLKAIVAEAPPDPRQFNPALPTDLVKIMGRSLYKNRSKRFADANAMAQPLERWLYKQENPPGPRDLANWIESLFAEERSRGEGTMVVRDVGEIFIPANDEQSGLQPADGEAAGVPQGRVDTMLSQVQAPSTGEISVSFEHSLNLEPLDLEEPGTEQTTSLGPSRPDSTVVSGPPASLSADLNDVLATVADADGGVAQEARLPAPPPVKDSAPDDSPPNPSQSAPDEMLNPLPPAATQADLNAMNSGGVQPQDVPQSNKSEGLLHNVLAGALVGLILVLSYLLFVGT